MRRSHTAVVERNVVWHGEFASEPYEVGWAGEALFFVRSLAGSGTGAAAAVQVSPDGMQWCDEGTALELPAEGKISFCRVARFGGWLRVAGRCREPVTVLLSLSLKE